jgi:hypothetical protein
MDLEKIFDSLNARLLPSPPSVYTPSSVAPRWVVIEIFDTALAVITPVLQHSGLESLPIRVGAL